MSNDYRDFNVNNRSNLFVRYASDDHGTDFSDKPSSDRPFIGILASGYRLNDPIKEDFDGLWQRYMGNPGQNAHVTIDPVSYSWVVNGENTHVVAVAQDTVLAESYCHGQTLARPGEEEDNAMYYMQVASSFAGQAIESVNKIQGLKDEIASQNEVIQDHIQTATDLNDEMTGKVAHVDSVLEHVDAVKLEVDGINSDLSEKFTTVEADAAQVAADKGAVITIKGQIDQSVLTVTQAANQVADDKVIIVQAQNLANEYKLAAAASAREARSYARGGTNSRQDEDIDNGLYYLTQTRSAAQDAIGSVTADKAAVLAAQQDVTAKAQQVSQNTQQVATDKGEVTTMKNTVVEKHGEVVTMYNTTQQNANQVAADLITVTNAKADVAGDKAVVVARADEVASAYTYITTNTQMMTMSINDDGYLIGEIVNATLFSFSILGNSDLVVSDTGGGGTLNLGPVTAYGEAVNAGYTGTYSEFTTSLMAAASNYEASEAYRDEAKAWAEGTPTQVAEYGGTKSAKDWAEDAKSARDTVIEFMNQTFVYGLLTDMTVGQTNALAASRKVVYDNMTHELVPVDSFVKEPCHDWKRLLLTYDNDNQVLTYLDPHDSRRLASGGTATLTGAAGDVMVRLPGVHGRKWEWTDTTNSHRMEAKLFSTDPFLNSVPDPGTLVGSSDGNPVDQLVGAFMGCHCDSSGAPKVHARFGSAAAYATGDRLRSIAGCRPAASIGATNYRTMARNAGLQCINWQTHRLIADLMAVHFGTYDIESAFCHGFNYMDTYTFRYFRKSGRSDVFGNGTGVIYAQDTVISTITVNDVVYSRAPLQDAVGTGLYGCAWQDENSNVVFTAVEDVVVGDTAYSDGGVTTSVGTVSAVTAGDPDCDLIGRWNATARNWTNKPVVMSFQGLEYPWGGGQYVFGDGGIKYQNGNGTTDYADSCILTCLDPANYTSTYSHPTIPTGYTRKYLRLPKASKWASWYDIDTMLPVIPDPTTLDFTGAANKSLCDYWYNDANAGTRAIYRGGTLFHGASAGPFNVYVYHSFSIAHVHNGARVASTVR